MSFDMFRRLVTGFAEGPGEGEEDESWDPLPSTQQRTLPPTLEQRQRVHTHSVKNRDMTWHDHLVMLLQIGAAIEHGLMVQYLYAAYSMDPEKAPDSVKPLVDRWRRSIVAVAVEEMGHMLTLQNVLMFVGAPVYLNRDDFPWDARYYPFPFRLEPLTDQSLACYVYAEMPEHRQVLARAHEPRYAQFLAVDAGQITDAIRQRDVTPHQVGMLYREIVALMKYDKYIPAARFRPDTVSFQASSKDWARSHDMPAEPDHPQNPSDYPAHVIISTVATRAEAVQALQEISMQGEGPEAGSDDAPSHFDRFLEIYQDYREMRKGGTWQISRKVPENPSTLVHEDAGNKGDFISSHRARYWGYLFNVRYRMLLTYLTHTFRLAREAPSSQPSVRAAVMHRVFGEMYNIKTISHIMMRCPFRDQEELRKHTDPEYAGPPFEMPFSLSLPTDDADCWQLYLGMFESTEKLSRALRNCADPQTKDYLWALRNHDFQSKAWIEEMLQGSRDQRGRHS